MTILKYIHIFFLSLLASELSVASFSSGGQGFALYLAFGSLLIAFGYLHYSKSLFRSQLFIILFIIMFFYRMYEPQFWYLTLSSENNTLIGLRMKILSLIQYMFGHLAIFILGLYIRNRNPILFRFDSIFIASLFNLAFWYSTSVLSLDIFLPLYATQLIEGMILPFVLFNVLFLSLIFEFFKSTVSLKFRHSAFYLTLLVLLLLVNNLNAEKTPPLPVEVVAIAEKSIVGDSPDFFENMKSLSLKSNSDTNKLYIWPEARFVFNRKNEAKIEELQKILINKLPGTHMVGIFLVKNDESQMSSNRYYQFTESTSMYIKKSAPVPFQEDASLFWFINPLDIKMSFNVEKGDGKNIMKYQKHRFSVFMCNELMNVSNILSQDLGDYIISPSNPPLQLGRLNEDLLNFYSKVLKNITNRTVLKISSKQEISLFSSEEEFISKETVKYFEQFRDQ